MQSFFYEKEIESKKTKTSSNFEAQITFKLEIFWVERSSSKGIKPPKKMFKNVKSFSQSGNKIINEHFILMKLFRKALSHSESLPNW